MSKNKVYAVANGRRPGIYRTWEEARVQVEGFSGATYKWFASVEEARIFMQEHGVHHDEDSSGDISGVMDDLQKMSLRSADEEPRHQGLPTTASEGETIAVYIGIAARGNGTPNCESGYACVFPHHADWNISMAIAAEAQSNMKAVLRAAIAALEKVMAVNGKKLVVYARDDYLVGMMNKWIDKWAGAQWRRSKNQRIENLELVQRLYNLRCSFEGTIQWTKVDEGTSNHDNWIQRANASASDAVGVTRTGDRLTRNELF